MLSEQALQQIAIEVAKYPADQKQSAVMSALRIAQVEYGWVSPEIMTEVAQVLD
ncbi:MAG: NAD(P)H-dependent oxidoreductase subunit E, partial [Burkholderiaceae bacterium]